MRQKKRQCIRFAGREEGDQEDWLWVGWGRKKRGGMKEGKGKGDLGGIGRGKEMIDDRACVLSVCMWVNERGFSHSSSSSSS